jgi:uncharacterized LabA/DUF88 family protein
MAQVVVYIDGQNFFHGLESWGLDGKSFNFKSYATSITEGKTLVAIKYYGAKYPKRLSLRKHNADDAFFKSLERMGVTVVEGKFKIDDSTGRPIAREKGVDVRLATDLIFDAVFGTYDHAYVLSSDTDLVPAIEQTKKQFKEKKIFNFSFQRLQEFIRSCDSCLLIYPDRAKKFIDPAAFQPTHQTISDLRSRFNNSR